MSFAILEPTAPARANPDFLKSDSTHYPVIIVGGGQAGLAMSYHLKQRDIEHLIFERRRMVESWRSERWDAFSLVTPNWQCTLPGFPYAGSDPDGFMVKNAIVEYLEAYARSFNPPLLEHTAVTKLTRDDAGRFAVSTTAGNFTADQVVIAAGNYQVPTIPRIGERLSPDIVQVHSRDYRNPKQLPAGAVLVVGSGQSGCQIAEDIHLTGRKVHLCIGSAPRTARRYRGKDVVAWLEQMGYYKKTIYEHPKMERDSAPARARANHYVTGRDGGRDIDLRKFALEGMSLHGRLKDIKGGRLHFDDNLKQHLDYADEVAENIKTTIDKYIESAGVNAPFEERYKPLWQPAGPDLPADIAAADIRSVVWSIGFRADYRWVDFPTFDGRGFPVQERGVTTVPGLYFLGLSWQYTWGSGRFSGVGQDAEFLAGQIEVRRGVRHRRPVANHMDDWALGS
jgi:putative flavoprotein involved in K+ transport